MHTQLFRWYSFALTATDQAKPVEPHTKQSLKSFNRPHPLQFDIYEPRFTGQSADPALVNAVRTKLDEGFEPEDAGLIVQDDWLFIYGTHIPDKKMEHALAIAFAQAATGPDGSQVAQFKFKTPLPTPRKGSLNYGLFQIKDEILALSNQGLSPAAITAKLEASHSDIDFGDRGVRDFQHQFLEKISARKFTLKANHPIPRKGTVHYKLLQVWQEVFNQGLSSREMAAKLKETHRNWGITARNIRDFQKSYLTL